MISWTLPACVVYCSSPGAGPSAEAVTSAHLIAVKAESNGQRGRTITPQSRGMTAPPIAMAITIAHHGTMQVLARFEAQVGHKTPWYYDGTTQFWARFEDQVGHNTPWYHAIVGTC